MVQNTQSNIPNDLLMVGIDADKITAIIIEPNHSPTIMMAQVPKMILTKTMIYLVVA